MLAFAISRYRAPLTLGPHPEPELGDGDVLVEVRAASLNRLDERIRRGALWPLLRHRFPLKLGHDVAGTVLRVGESVRSFAVGDEVFGCASAGRSGSFAERIALPESDLARKPVGLSWVEAAALPLVTLTAWQAFVESGDVRLGARVLVPAGAGGVGSVAIQLAVSLGAEVTTTVRSENRAFVQALGAHRVIDYRRDNVELAAAGADLVLDSVGGSDLDASLRLLRPGGTVIGLTGPPDPEYAREAGLGWVLSLATTGMSAGVRRRARRLGVTYRFLMMRADGAQLARIARLTETGAIRPVVGRVVPFADTATALTGLENGGHRGKTVVEMR
ncbi:NADP-dependent oxidoreductase [Leucobacter sp. M11]|uniref:NADP-dependent oxidoreductase n=1 Tax=Leucobacter sp. M11 TaxID=2993565 RepID=UPI002D801341|nr:NADP-dependent oxidoreductase [Leucobacter sp. M11]MEB4616620.1 NADP-dependent oxidoreductase [Leucobacter sp. M11]